MPLKAFDHNEMILVRDALDIAEDTTGNFFKFSLGQWKRHRYEVKTLNSLEKDEIRSYGFALLNKYGKPPQAIMPMAGLEDYYAICLQDHVILNALKRDEELGLLALLVYVFTHELVHIVRFCNFLKNFDASGEEREKEEKAVHATTYEILKGLSMPRLGYILDSYESHRLSDMVCI